MSRAPAPRSEDPAVPNLVHYGPGGILHDSHDVAVCCSWTAGCTADAVTLVQHPVLGGVPCCQAHADWARP